MKSYTIRTAFLLLLMGRAQIMPAQCSSRDSLQCCSTTGKDCMFSAAKLIIPSAGITYGILSLTSDDLEQLNLSTRHEINEHRPAHINLDNYTQYVPAVLVYGLNLSGIKGEHNFRDRTIIYATSQLLSAAVVVPLKHAVKEERPDGSDNLSFPSGHTATAFSAAQFMFREYRHKNFCLSIAGYPFAVFTAVYRTLNNKHWVGDVVAGAGIGILSTEAAYWLFPKVNKIFKRKNSASQVAVLPYYQPQSPGISLVKVF